MSDHQSLRPACAYAQSGQRFCESLAYSRSVKLLITRHLEFLSLKGGCLGSSESTLVKMPQCLKSHVTAHLSLVVNSRFACADLENSVREGPNIFVFSH